MAAVPPHVVIVGAGFGGLAAARALARDPVRVTLVDRHNYHVFQPLLYQVATAQLSPGDIASPIRWILRRQQNVTVLLSTARSIETAQKRVVLDTGELGYDFLVLAAGASYTYFGHDGWARVASGLKSLDDALLIRRQVLLAFERAELAPDAGACRRLLTFIVIGGGPTGVELAGALAELAHHALAHEFRAIDPGSARVVLLEGGPDILAAFPERSRRAARTALGRLGVEVRTGVPVTEVGESWVSLGRERIEGGTVLWAAGVAALPLGRALGVPVDRSGRVIVEPDLSIPGHPDVFVIGDLAAFRHQGAGTLPGLAPVAIQEARQAARNIRHRMRAEPAETFRYHDRGLLATIGRAEAVAVFGSVTLSGWVAWVSWLFVHIWQLIGFRNRVSVMLQWAHAYVTRQRALRLITRDPDPD